MRTTTRISLFFAGAAVSGAVAYTLTTLARARNDLLAELRELRDDVTRIAEEVAKPQDSTSPSPHVDRDPSGQPSPASGSPPADDGKGELLDRALDNGSTLDDLEGEYIRMVLEGADGNRSQAARVLGIDRRTLYRKLLRHGIPGQES